MPLRASDAWAVRLGLAKPASTASRFGKPRWCEFEGKARFYARSSWEANYACYLEWQKSRGEIKDWTHEPRTYWFDKAVTIGKRRLAAIRRGVNSYKPDFSVIENDGREVLHEVKGRKDRRSVQTIKRMGDRYPDVKLIVIDSKQYNSLKAQLSKLIPGWV